MTLLIPSKYIIMQYDIINFIFETMYIFERFYLFLEGREERRKGRETLM